MQRNFYFSTSFVSLSLLSVSLPLLPLPLWLHSFDNVGRRCSSTARALSVSQQKVQGTGAWESGGRGHMGLLACNARATLAFSSHRNWGNVALQCQPGDDACYANSDTVLSLRKSAPTFCSQHCCWRWWRPRSPYLTSTGISFTEKLRALIEKTCASTIATLIHARFCPRPRHNCDWRPMEPHLDLKHLSGNDRFMVADSSRCWCIVIVFLDSSCCCCFWCWAVLCCALFHSVEIWETYFSAFILRVDRRVVAAW